MTTEEPRAGVVTAREREVLSLVATHLTNKQIAHQLCLSVRTVETHVSSLLRKLEVADRRSLAREAGRVEASTFPERARWPAPVSTFVGREAERRALLAVAGSHRLVTVTGPGGVGKTRLALQVAQEFAAGRRDGGWFVDLIQVSDPPMVIAAVASAVGVAEQHAVPLGTPSAPLCGRATRCLSWTTASTSPTRPAPAQSGCWSRARRWSWWPPAGSG